MPLRVALDTDQYVSAQYRMIGLPTSTWIDANGRIVDRQTGREVTRIDVGAAQANASFTTDGATAFVTVSGADSVVAIDMIQLAVVARFKVGGQPMGLALLEGPT